MARPCIAPSALEDFALRGEGDPAISEHLERCDACRALVEDIRANEQFLAGAAPAIVDGLTASAMELSRFKVDGYEIIAEISRGGQGVVCRAVQKATKRPAAIKMLLAGSLASDRQRGRFDREIEIAAALRHPYIVTVFQSGSTADGLRFVAMEYIEGLPLDAHIRERVPEDARSSKARIDRVMRLFSMIAAGVAHAHGAGVIHRDLKPSNILIDDAGAPHIVDFGLARVVEMSSAYSYSREFAGTPAYAAPEQLDPTLGDVGASTDVYALGLMMYSALTGTHPYPLDASLPDLVRHAVSTPPVAPSKLVARLPGDVETIVLKALSKDPLRRYPSAAALGSDIDDYLSGRPISARRDSAMYVLGRLASRHRGAALAAVFMLLTLAGAALGLALLARDLDHERVTALEALSASNIHRARLMAATGEIQQAEQLLWEEAFAAGVDPNATDLSIERSPAARRATWAMMEYYSRIPRVMRVPFGRLPSRVRFDESGSRIEALGADGVLARWESDGRQLEMTQPVWDIDPGYLSRVSASGAGGMMAVSLPSGLRAYDAYTRAWVTPPNPSVTNARMVLLTPDGAHLAVHDASGRVQILDPQTWEVTATLIEPGGANGSMLFSRNGAYMVIEIRGPSGGSIRRWSTADWSEISPPMTASRVPRVAFELPQNPAISNDGRWIAAGLGGNVAFWSADSPDIPVIALAHRASVNGVWFSDDASMAVSASPDGDMFVWELPEARLAVRWRNGDRALCVDIRRDLGKVAVADEGGFVSVYELRPHPWNERFPVPPDGTLALAVSDDGQRIAWGGLKGVITVLDRPTGATIEIQGHDALLTALRFLPGDRGLVSAGLDGAVRIWDPRTGAALRTIDEGLPGLWSVAANSANDRVIATGVEGEIFSWGLGDGASRVDLTEGSARVPMADFSPSGANFVAVSVDGTAALWDTASNRVVHRLLGHTAAVRAAAFSPDGTVVATGSDDRTIRFWDTRTGEPAGVIEGLPRDVFRLVFHPSGRLLFCAGRGPEVMVFDVERKENLATLVAHERSVFAMEITPDGNTIITCGEDGWVAVWDLARLRSYVTGNAPPWRAPNPTSRLSSHASSSGEAAPRR